MTPNQSEIQQQLTFKTRIDGLVLKYLENPNGTTFEEMTDACIEAFKATITYEEAKSIWFDIMLTLLPIPTKRRLANYAIALVYKVVKPQPEDQEIFEARFATRHDLQQEAHSKTQQN